MTRTRPVRLLGLAIKLFTIAACSSSTPSEGPASTSPSQASAVPSSISTAVATAAPPSGLIQTSEYAGVVFAVKSVSQTGMTSVGNAPLDGVWLPSESDIVAFESGLAAHMTKTVPAAHKELPTKLKSYKRQWFGVTAGNKKLVYANFICRELPGWREHTIMVDDGGDCYFQLFYDVASREYLSLMINGHA